jgi:hypothetical protein
MGSVVTALWQGFIAGALTKGTAPRKPAFGGIFASVAEALYDTGYAVGSIVIHGKANG